MTIEQELIQELRAGNHKLASYAIKLLIQSQRTGLAKDWDLAWETATDILWN